MSTPAPRGQRGGDELPADAAEPHAHPVVHAHGGGQLAGEPRPRNRRLGRRRALEPGEQRRGEDVEGERRGDRVAGRAEDRRAASSDHAEHHRVARPHRHAVHGERSDLGHDRGRVVVAARARAGDHDHEVRPRGGRAHRRGDLVGTSGVTSKRCASQPAASAWAASITRVRVGELALAELGADRADLVAGRDHRDDRPAPHDQLGRSRRARRRHIHRPQPVPGGEQQLRRAHVLADRAHVLVRRGGGAQLDRLAVELVHVLAHDDGVEVARDRVAGVDDLEAAGLEPDRRGLAGADRVGRVHGDAVHGRRVERR